MSAETKAPRIVAKLHAAPSRATVAGDTREELSLRWTAESQAFARGLERGRTEAFEGAAGALDKATLELARQREKATADLAHTSVLLATKIARELLRAEIDLGHYDLERVVRDALAVSGVGRGTCVVHLNPIDAERLKHVPFRAGLTIEADHEVARGDVHLTTPVGVLVRDIDDALEAIGEKIRGGLS